MSQLAYLGGVVVTLCCMVIMDHRWRLFFWADARRAAVVLGASFAFFLTWDAVALAAGYYERAGSRYMTDVEILGLVPVEEPFFCAFLPYLTMVVHALLRRGLGDDGARP